MDKNHEKVSMLLSEVEDDYLLNDSDDAHAYEFCIQNNVLSEI